jgi:hypothetical protein
MTEVAGATAGCDVCGVLVAADKVSLHNEWHRTRIVVRNGSGSGLSGALS